MSIPPEVAFSRYFQENYPYVAPVRPEDPDRRRFRGKHDLRGLPTTLQEQLRLIQDTFNIALSNERQGVVGHVDHPPFHIDYVDSDEENAFAFRYGGYSFIAITLPLIYRVSDVCLKLSKSPEIITMLSVNPSEDPYNEIHMMLFYALMAFVVTHEYTHVVRGHVDESGTILRNEFLSTVQNGNLDMQIQELAADGYAAYHVMANIFDAPAGFIA